MIAMEMKTRLIIWFFLGILLFALSERYSSYVEALACGSVERAQELFKKTISILVQTFRLEISGMRIFAVGASVID